MTNTYAFFTVLLSVPDTDYFILLNNPLPVSRSMEGLSDFRYVALPDRINITMVQNDIAAELLKKDRVPCNSIDEDIYDVQRRLMEELPDAMLPVGGVHILKAVRHSDNNVYDENIYVMGTSEDSNGVKYDLINDGLFTYADFVDVMKDYLNSDTFRIVCNCVSKEASYRPLTKEEINTFLKKK